MDEKIHHYEKKILKIETDENYSYCLAKLSKLPITVRELKNTRVLQSVKRIVKKSPDSDAGHEAQKLIKRWNAILSAHDVLKEQKKERSSDPIHDNSSSSKPSRTEHSSSSHRKENGEKSSRKSLLDSSTYGGSWSSVEPQPRSLNDLFSESNPSADCDINSDMVSDEKLESEPYLSDKEFEPSKSESYSQKKDNHTYGNVNRDVENGYKAKEDKKRDKEEKVKSEEKSRRKEEKQSAEKDRSRSEKSHKSSHFKDDSARKENGERESRKEKNRENGIESCSKQKRKSEVKEVNLFGEEGPSKEKKSRRSDSPAKHKEIKSTKTSKSSSDTKTGKLEQVIAKPSVTLEDLQSSVLQSIDQPVPYYAIDQPSTSFKAFDPLPPLVRPKATEKPRESGLGGLEQMLSQKGKIGKVFSGKKSVGNQHVPTLLKLCQQVLEVNLDMLEYTGGIPYELLRPVLQKANADQLSQIEQFNPYLLEDTDELWKVICHQHFRKQSPQEYETWRDVYFRCYDEREAKFANLTSKISSKARQAVPVRQTKLAFVEPLPSNSSLRTAPSNVKKLGSMGAAKAKQLEASSQQAEVKVKASGREAPRVRAAPNAPPLVVQRKAPLMQKTLMLMKNRFKR